nr:MAG TPA: hypothetical protein [Caudoviricetes sp.]
MFSHELLVLFHLSTLCPWAGICFSVIVLLPLY